MQISSSDLQNIYDIHFTKIYRFFYFKTVSKETAEDLTSETFISFAALISGKEMQDPVAYLYGIAKLNFIKFLKRKYQENTVPLEDWNASIVEQTLQKIDNSPTPEERLAPYIAKLPEKQKEIIQLRLIQKLTLDEIVTQLGKDMNYVKTTQKRAIQSLKKLITCTPIHT